ILQIQNGLKTEKAIMGLPAESNAFTEFVQYALPDFTLNILKTWCEKKEKDADYVWLVSNNFSKEKKDNLKLLDSVGTLVKIDSTHLVMESSGRFNSFQAKTRC
ncbi:hypothetical protein INT48_005202, partial [Thamnidium elegans]